MDIYLNKNDTGGCEECACLKGPRGASGVAAIYDTVLSTVYHMVIPTRYGINALFLLLFLNF
jgi:hypothetical protein